MMLALLVGMMIIEDNDDDNSDNDDVERTGEMLTVVPPAIMIYVYSKITPPIYHSIKSSHVQ